MKQLSLFSTKAKLSLSAGLLFVIIFLVGLHLLQEQKQVLSSLVSIDKLRLKQDAVVDVAEKFDELIIMNAKALAGIEQLSAPKIKEELILISRSADKLDGIDVALQHQIRQSVLNAAKEFKNENIDKQSLKESLIYMIQASDYLREANEKITDDVTSLRYQIRSVISKNPYDTLWILIAASCLILALFVVVTTEIFLPLQLITQGLVKAGENPDDILSYRIEKPRTDEAGKAQQALNSLFTILSENLKELTRTNQISQRRLDAIEIIREGVGMTDPDGHLIYANKPFFLMHGINPAFSSEYIGHNWKKLLNEKDASQIELASEPSLKEAGHWDGQITLHLSESNIRQIDMALTVMDDGKVLCTLQDITERINFQLEQERLQELFAQSQKMEAVGRLTGGVAHDFNNILTIISGNLDLLKDYAQDETTKYISTAERAVRRGAELTQRLLSFSRKQVLSPKIININEILPESLTLLSRVTGEDVDILFNMEASLWNTRIDAGQFENALLNLVINARDAIHDGGDIVISTKNVWIGGQHNTHNFSFKPGAYIQLTVKDSGEGIPRHLLNKIFDPFFTTKAEGKGTGLGLSMVYGFVKQSGGYVTVESEEGKGTSVNLIFPRFEGEGKEPLYVETVLTSNKTQASETILIAEDEIDLLELNENILSRAGYKILTARNGNEALKIIESNARIDLLLTDVVMPGGISGRELSERARFTRPDLKILVVSGYADLPSPEIVADAQMKFLAKPFSQAKLLQEVASLLNLKANLSKSLA